MLDFIANPIAGGKKGKKIKNAIEYIEATLRKKGIEYAIHLTEGIGSSRKITENLIKEGATTIVVIGGDGSLHEVLNGFTDFSNTALGVIPCGTGNDFAKALIIPENVEKSLDILLNGKPQFVDFMQMPTVRGLNIIGTGLDVEVLKRYAKSKRKTKLTYTTSLLKTFLSFDYSQFDAVLDGEKASYKSFIACVANGHCYGGGIPICPSANPFDNKLDFVAIKSMNKLKILRAFIKLKKGKILTLPQTTHKTMQEVKIVPTGNYTVNVDGELYDNIPFDIKIVSNKLRVIR